MLLMHRNLKSMWYAQWESKTPIVDSNGYETGESVNNYSFAEELRCNVSPERSYIMQEAFGPRDPYEIVLITSDMNCPVTETSVFWDHKPVAGEPHQYVVRRVSKSLNHISITLKKVMVS